MCHDSYSSSGWNLQGRLHERATGKRETMDKEPGPGGEGQKNEQHATGKHHIMPQDFLPNAEQKLATKNVNIFALSSFQRDQNQTMSEFCSITSGSSIWPIWTNGIQCDSDPLGAVTKLHWPESLSWWKVMHSQLFCCVCVCVCPSILFDSYIFVCMGVVKKTKNTNATLNQLWSRLDVIISQTPKNSSTQPNYEPNNTNTVGNHNWSTKLTIRKLLDVLGGPWIRPLKPWLLLLCKYSPRRQVKCRKAISSKESITYC